MAYHVSQHGIEAASLKFRLDKIKEVCLRLGMLGYAKKTAPILSLVNNIQPVDIQTPSKKVIDLDTDEEKSKQEIGAGGAMQGQSKNIQMSRKPTSTPMKSNAPMQPVDVESPRTPTPGSQPPKPGEGKGKLREYGVKNPETGVIEGQ